MNSRLLEASSETGTIKSDDAQGSLAIADTQSDPNRHAGPMRAGPGPFQDIPQRVWAIFLSAWALVFTLLILFFTVTLAAAFVVTVAALFGLMAFGLPMLMAAQGRCDGHECRGVVYTRTGPLSGAAAGTQIVLIPVAAVIGLTAFIAFAM